MRKLIVFKPLFYILGFGFAYLFIFIKFGFGIPCPFYKLTGYMCPGCGMTRAIASMWRLDFKAALEYNALSLSVFPLMCLYMLIRWLKETIKKQDGFSWWEYTFLILVFIVLVKYGIERNSL